MFRDMRRIRQLLPEDKTIEVMERCTVGTLGVIGDEGYPYTVPLSYIYDDGKIYFHCAKKGHKIDAIKANDKVTFSVIDKNEIIPEKYTTYFRSAIAFGRARIVEDEGQARAALEKLAAKYSPDYEEGRLKEIDKQFKGVCMVEIAIEHMTGKEAIELVKAAGK